MATQVENNLSEPQAPSDDVPVQPVEISRDEAIRSLLTNELLSDLTIRGSDGSVVIANRCFLASRSPIFCRMLFGNFSEASKAEIDVGYDGVVLQAIVEYIYTDTVVALEKKAEDYKAPWDISLVRFSVNLIDAAEYFSLPELRRKIETAALKQMKKHQVVVPLFLAACVPNCDATTVLQEMALKKVKKRPQILVDGSKSSLALIHPSYVENILKEERLPVNEYSCFRILQSWANAEATDDNGFNSEEGGWQQNRKRMAAQMMNHVDLAGIATTELSTSVASSGLVTAEHLSDAYKTQALRAEKRQRVSYEEWRGGYVWKSSGTVVAKKGSVTMGSTTTTLDCPFLKSGVHKWSIKVLRGSNRNVVVGVASSCWPIEPGISLRNQRGGWGLREGTAGHALGHENATRRNNLPSFSEGSTISFTLDLEKGGILSASIDGDRAFKLFSGMSQDHYEGDGFVPAVSVAFGAGVEFLGFD